MNELYSTDLEAISNEIKTSVEIKNEEFLNIKLELLQTYLMCYTLYKENENEDILQKLIKLTNLLKKCKQIENHIDEINNVKSEESSKRILNDFNKKRYKKTKGNNPRKKFKDRSDKMNEKCTKKYDGKI